MKDKIYRIMECIAGAALILASCILVVNILKGKITGVPLKGTYEMIALCCSIMAAMAIPMATLTGSHVAVDIVVKMFGVKGQMFFDYFARFVDAVIGGVLCFASGRFAMKMLETQEATENLGIPIWPFRFVWMLGCLLVVVFSIWRMFQVKASYADGGHSNADAEIEEAKKAAEELYDLKPEEGGGEA